MPACCLNVNVLDLVAERETKGGGMNNNLFFQIRKCYVLVAVDVGGGLQIFSNLGDKKIMLHFLTKYLSVEMIY